MHIVSQVISIVKELTAWRNSDHSSSEFELECIHNLRRIGKEIYRKHKMPFGQKHPRPPQNSNIGKRAERILSGLITMMEKEKAAHDEKVRVERIPDIISDALETEMAERASETGTVFSL